VKINVEVFWDVTP